MPTWKCWPHAPKHYFTRIIGRYKHGTREPPNVFLTGVSGIGDTSGETDGVDDVTDARVQDRSVAVSCIGVLSDASETRLYTGDEVGVIRVWDLAPLIKDTDLLPIPADKQPASTPGYNPRRRIVITGVDSVAGATVVGTPFDSTKPMEVIEALSRGSPTSPGPLRMVNRASMVTQAVRRERAATRFPGFGGDGLNAPHAIMGQVGGASKSSRTAALNPMLQAARRMRVTPLIHQWKGHTGAVLTMCVIRDPPSVLTSGQDMAVKVWGMTGDLLGVLRESTEQQSKIWRGFADRASRASRCLSEKRHMQDGPYVVMTR